MGAESQVAFVRADGPLDERARRAIRWIEGLERATGLRAGLLTPHAKDYGGLIQAFGRNHRSTSVRTAGDVGDGPLLVYCTGLDSLAKFGKHRPLVYVARGSDRGLDG